MGAIENDYQFLPYLFEQGVFAVKEKQAAPQPVAKSQPVAQPVAPPAHAPAPAAAPAPVAPAAAPSPAPQPVVLAPLLGQKASKLLVLVGGAANALPANQIDLLGKIMQAINLSPADYAVYQTASDEQLNQALQQSPAGTVLLFGLEYKPEKALPFNEAQHQAGRTWLRTHALAEVDQDVAKKKALWAALKKLSF